MFDGKTLNGWESLVSPQLWSVQDGMIIGRQVVAVGDDQVNLLFFTRERCRDFEFKANIRLHHGGISSMYFRAQVVGGFAPAYIAQADNSAESPQRTGSLYNYFAPLNGQLVPDETWWTQHVIAEGNQIRSRVNDNDVVTFADAQNTHTEGYLALLYYLPRTVVQLQNLVLRKLDWSTQ
jgi:hypothetical protein